MLWSSVSYYCSIICIEGVCPVKLELILNDVDILPTLDGNMAKWIDFLLSMIDLLLAEKSFNEWVIGKDILKQYTHFHHGALQ